MFRKVGDKIQQYEVKEVIIQEWTLAQWEARIAVLEAQKVNFDAKKHTDALQVKVNELKQVVLTAKEIV